MKYFFLLNALLMNYIFCYYPIPGSFNHNKPLSTYITPENDMLVYNPNEGDLYKFMTSKTIRHTNSMKLNTTKFPANTSENIKDIYFNIYEAGYYINVTYFNEKYLSSFLFNPNSKNITYDSYKVEHLEHNKLLLFLSPENYTIQNNTINIVKLNFTNEKKRFTIIKSYNLSIYSSRVNCIPINNDIILCQFNEYIIYKEKSYIYNKKHYLALLQNETDISKQAIIVFDKNITSNKERSMETQSAQLLISLGNGKVIYCINDDIFSCGLIQIQNNNKITILKKHEKIYDYFGTKNTISAKNINENQIVLSLFEAPRYVKFAKITITNNNEFEKLYYDFRGSYFYNKYFYFSYLLKNNDNDLILIVTYDDEAIFEELGYVKCSDVSEYLYNGDYYDITFKFDYNIFNDNIVFIDENNRTIHSLFSKKDNKSIMFSEIYNSSSIFYYNLSAKDYKIFKDTYEIKYANSLDIKRSKRCSLSLYFLKCPKYCEICRENEEVCYDENYNKVNILKATIKNYFILILILSIVILAILIILIFLIYRKCRLRKSLSNNETIENNENNNQNELPIIPE